MPRVNLLVADDVGLGKTIETGLVIQELILRHRVRSVLVVCPASLCLKWQQEMAGRLGLEFRIVDSELIRGLRRERGLSASPWRHFPRLITSMDWLKSPRAMSLMREVLSQYSPHTYPRAFEHRIYLSATPHNGYSESWQALLELLDRSGSPAASTRPRSICGA